ncbi:Putative pectinesterase/pectinesterase inhibitor 24 [Linum perenne]
MKRREYLEVLEKDEKVLRRKADVVVAKDGSGKYKTIGEALKEVPKKSKKKRFVIYVKKGVYKENVRVEKNMWNVVMVGDGMDATVVTGSRNVVDGTPTFSTATFAVLGKGFIARDMGFINTAGPSKHQAVALMCNGDMSVFYRCNFDAFQDTLYPHANRQFYSHCNISGTVDFIFGNSAVIIQNSNILPKVPMKGQKNTITAQGKTDPNQNTGIVVHNCNVVPYRGNWKGGGGSG